MNSEMLKKKEAKKKLIKHTLEIVSWKVEKTDKMKICLKR